MTLFITVILAAASFSAFAETVAGPGYDPYSLNCIYIADSKWQVTSDIDADIAYFGYKAERLDGSEAGQITLGEFKEVFINYPGEDKAADKIAKDLSLKLGIDFSKVFTITEFIQADSSSDPYTMKFYMLNGANGKLGAGVYSEVSGSVYLTLCE